MDPEYQAKLDLLDTILRDGISKLLTEAKKNGYLDQPYGRLPFPTPLITEKEFINLGALESDDTEPEFNFQYGFDPLKFLGDFIMWSHPNSVEQRRLEKVNAAAELTRRAEHAKKQIYIGQSLKEIAKLQSSGMLWGPLIVAISSTSIQCTAMPLKAGKVILQISLHKDFREMLKTIERRVEFADSGENGEPPGLADLLPVKVVLGELVPSTKYFIRCCLSSDPECIDHEAKQKREMTADSVKISQDAAEDVSAYAFKGLPGGLFSSTHFWTVPSEDRNAPPSATIADEVPVADAPATNHRLSTRRHSTKKEHKLALPPPAAEPAVDAANLFTPVEVNAFGQLPLEAYTTAAYKPPSKLPSLVAASHKSTTSRSSGGSGTNSPMMVSPQSSTSSLMKQLPRHSAGGKSNSTSSLVSKVPTVTCLLGDLIPHQQVADPLHPKDGASAAALTAIDETAETFNSYLLSMSKLLSRCPLFQSPTSPFASSTFLLGWRDGSKGSHYSLRAEELLYKQYRHEVKRQQKKFAKSKVSSSSGGGGGGALAMHAPAPPPIKRLPFTDAIRSLLTELPIDPALFEDPPLPDPAKATGSNAGPKSAAAAKAASEAAAKAAFENVRSTRMMYRSLMMGPDVMLIVLDMRGKGIGGDYLGQEQAAWLESTLTSSSSIQWKIILSGRSFGLVSVMSEDELAPSPDPTRPSTSATTAAAAGEGAEAEGIPAGAAAEAEGGGGGGGGGEEGAAAAGVLSVPVNAAGGALVQSAVPAATAAAAAKTEDKKSVQFPHDRDKNHAAITSAVKEGLEDVYGRNKYSLPHVLAEYQAYLNRDDRSVVYKPLELDSHVVHLSAGLVLLTSGLSSICPDITAHNNYSERYLPLAQEDVVSPAFVAGYSNLSAPSLAELEDPDTAVQILPLGSSLHFDSLVNDGSMPNQAPMFCLEIGLGQMSGAFAATTGTAGAITTTTATSSGGGGGGGGGEVAGADGDSPLEVDTLADPTADGANAQAPTTREFYYRDGFTCETIFSALKDVSEMDVAPASAPTATATGAAADEEGDVLNTVAHCNLQLMQNGQLRLQMFHADAITRAPLATNKPVFECTLEAPMLGGSSIDGESHQT